MTSVGKLTMASYKSLRLWWPYLDHRGENGLYDLKIISANLLRLSTSNVVHSIPYVWGTGLNNMIPSPWIRLRWHLACLNFRSLVMFGVGLLEEKPKTPFPMSFSCGSHIAASMLMGC